LFCAKSGISRWPKRKSTGVRAVLGPGPGLNGRWLPTLCRPRPVYVGCQKKKGFVGCAWKPGPKKRTPHPLGGEVFGNPGKKNWGRGGLWGLRP